ncbi:hypothetical protein XENORESO_017987, partial [Xenotaenia resolanae]
LHLKKTSQRYPVHVCVHLVAKCQMHFLGQQPGEKQSRSSTTESTIVSDLFEGRLSYLTHFVPCGHQAHNAQTFTVLSLPIPKDNKNCSIQVCFIRFVTWYCSRSW